MDISTPLPSLFFSFSLYPPPPSLPTPLPDDDHVELHAVPELGEMEVLVKMLAVSICAGDAKCYMQGTFCTSSVETMAIRRFATALLYMKIF